MKKLIVENTGSISIKVTIIKDDNVYKEISEPIPNGLQSEPFSLPQGSYTMEITDKSGYSECLSVIVNDNGDYVILKNNENGEPGESANTEEQNGDTVLKVPSLPYKM